MKKILLILVSIFLLNECNAQYQNNNFIKDKSDLINIETAKPFQLYKNNEYEAKNKKNPVLSVALSLLLPGAGHLYSGRMDVGAYFLGAEAAMWLGYFGMNSYGNALREDSRSFAQVHASLNKEGKDDNYFSNVGNYINIYEYNNAMLQTGNYQKLYDIGNYFWNWDNTDNQLNFEQQRKKSERVLNNRVIFVSGMIINRIVSSISALVLTNKSNSGNGISINPQIISSKENILDGIKLNIVKSF